MELHRCEWQFRDDIGSVQHHVACLAWESEDEVSAAVEAVGVDELDGVASGGEGVATVDAKKSLVVDGFDADFDDYWISAALIRRIRGIRRIR